MLLPENPSCEPGQADAERRQSTQARSARGSAARSRPRTDSRNGATAPDATTPPLNSAVSEVAGGHAGGAAGDSVRSRPEASPSQLRVMPSEDDIPDLYKTPPLPVITPARRLINLWKRRNEQGRTEEQNDELISAALGQLTDKFYVIPVIGPKGGSGKTLLSLVCGLILSEHRNARPCLLEANMDWGTLRDLLGDANPRTIKHLLNDLPDVDRAGYGALQGYLTMFGRLPVLTAPTSPDDMQALTPGDYDKVVSLLSKHMQILFLDCGTSFVNRISQYAAQTADHTILVAAPDNPTMRRSIASAHYLASSRYVSTYREVMPDLTVLGEKRDLTRLAMGSMTLAVNGIGKSSQEVPLDYEALARQLPDMNGIVKLPYSERLEALINTGRLDIEVLPANYRRQAKQLLATVLTKMAEGSNQPRQ
ncbi:MAG: hypothetical protein M3P51_05675 [Chloroflexota bacterium]|nr:hypothetical protein [Chloroflexota bacterium]